ncbi:MAG: hypothetical protein WB586_13450 [Chthoniobacterales bacterium]
MVKEEDLDPLFRYRDRVTNDPLRISILGAHALIEELIELVIAEAVPNSECFRVPKMQFRQKLEIIRALEIPAEAAKGFERHALLWKCIDKLNQLRNAAAHRNYETLRDKRFTELANLLHPDSASQVAHDWGTLLEEVTEICAGALMGMQDTFRRLRQGS